MKREKELALTLATKLVEQDKTITDSKKMANASVEVAKILEQYLKESTDECFKNPYNEVFSARTSIGYSGSSQDPSATSITTEDNQQAYYTGGGKLP